MVLDLHKHSAFWSNDFSTWKLKNGAFGGDVLEKCDVFWVVKNWTRLRLTIWETEPCPTIKMHEHLVVFDEELKHVPMA